MRLDSPDRAYARVAEGALLSSVQHLRERRRFLHEDWVKSVAFSPYGRTLATGSSDKTAWLWEVGQRVVDLACARVRLLPLSEEDRQRFGITKEWCTPEVSAELRAKTKHLEEAVEAYRTALQE